MDARCRHLPTVVVEAAVELHPTAEVVVAGPLEVAVDSAEAHRPEVVAVDTPQPQVTAQVAVEAARTAAAATRTTGTNSKFRCQQDTPPSGGVFFFLIE